MKEKFGVTGEEGPKIFPKETFIEKVCTLLKSTNDIS